MLLPLFVVVLLIDVGVELPRALAITRPILTFSLRLLLLTLVLVEEDESVFSEITDLTLKSLLEFELMIGGP